MPKSNRDTDFMTPAHNKALTSTTRARNSLIIQNSRINSSQLKRKNRKI